MSKENDTLFKCYSVEETQDEIQKYILRYFFYKHRGKATQSILASKFAKRHYKVTVYKGKIETYGWTQDKLFSFEVPFSEYYVLNSRDYSGKWKYVEQQPEYRAKHQLWLYNHKISRIDISANGIPTGGNYIYCNIYKLQHLDIQLHNLKHEIGLEKFSKIKNDYLWREKKLPD